MEDHSFFGCVPKYSLQWEQYDFSFPINAERSQRAAIAALKLMHPFTILQSKIQAALLDDVRLIDEVFDEQNFGNWIATYEGSRGSFRLIWDARDGWGFLQRRFGDEAWSDIEPLIAEGDIEGIPPNAQKLGAFEQSVRFLIEEVL